LRETTDVATDRIDSADDLVAKHGWKGRGILIRTVARRDVGVVEAESFNGNTKLTGTRLRSGCFTQLESAVRCAVANEVEGLHSGTGKFK
jgi:hypothetical protein